MEYPATPIVIKNWTRFRVSHSRSMSLVARTLQIRCERRPQPRMRSDDREVLRKPGTIDHGQNIDQHLWRSPHEQCPVQPLVNAKLGYEIFDPFF
jgi:hypothetical protein